MPNRDQTTRVQRRRTTSPGRRLPMSWLIGGVAVVVVAVAVIAVLLSGASTPASAAPQPADQPVQVGGSPLPALPTSGADPAVGMTLPTITSIDLSAEPATIDPGDGHPKLVMALAHWCPHCQAELPTFVSWLANHPLPANVELIAIATAIDPTRPNYPPSAWLEGEHWPGRVLVDDANSSALAALGLNSFPGWVLVGSDGTVLERLTGEQGTDVYPGLVAQLK